ncbi:MAG: hypothetical protein AABW50_04270 [Nanoarchaeota archaeon]
MRQLSKILGIGIAVLVFLFLIVGAGKLWQNVDANEIVVIQAPVSGELNWHVTPGLKWQGWGSVTTYPKRAIYQFEISVRFNDGGHGTMFGSVQYDMPNDVDNLKKLHTKYGSKEAIQSQLVKTVTDKSVYMTGPLMTSKESYAEKRNYLLSYVEDQIVHGVYKTLSREAKMIDQMTGAEKTITVVEIVLKEGIPERQEEAVLASFGIRPFNFAIEKLPYDEAVETQIKMQQQITMDVQTAIADAKKAEQRTITVVEQGKADAAKAKWDQEVIKAQQVTEAEQKLEVARLGALAAEQYKKEQILRADGDSEYKRRVMEADGALTQKLATYKDVNIRYAEAIEKYTGAWVPSIVMGGDGKSGTSNGAQDLISLLLARTAKDLSLDLSVKGK